MIQALDLPLAELKERLRAGAVAWVTVNPVEFHGPHLPLHTDRWQAEGLARDLHAALGEPGEPLLCADLELGVDPAPGPGSRHAPYGTVVAEVQRAVDGLAALGATRFALVTFHGAPLHNLALHAVVERLRARGLSAVAPFQAVVRLLLEPVEPHGLDGAVAMLPEARREVVADALPWDFHGGYFETSLMLHWAPHVVSGAHTALPPCPEVTPDRWLLRASRVARRLGRAGTAAELEFAARGVGFQRLRPFPGYSGHPADANAQAGRWFAELALDRALPPTRAALTGSPLPDRPSMAWVGPATAWGRLGP